MKKYLLCALCGLLSVSAANARVVDFYVGATASAGGSVAYYPKGFSSDVKDPSNSFGAVLGIDIPFFRIEGEYNYIISKESKLNALMLNAYIKPLPIPYVKPYVGVGFGSMLGGTINGGEDAKTAAASQAMLGLQIEVPITSLALDIECRAFYANDVYKIPGVDKDVGFLQYDWRLKLRYLF